MTAPTRARRWAIGLWIVMAVVVWNGLYDLRITLGVRDHLMKQALHDAALWDEVKRKTESDNS